LPSSAHEFDVALSFAGCDRDIAEYLKTRLEKARVKVFYDAPQAEDLWGADVPVRLADVYRKRSAFCLMLVSQAYVDRAWTNYERQAAIARAIAEKGRDYILPVRIEPVEVPGFSPTIGYLNLKGKGAIRSGLTYSLEQIANMAIRKVKAWRKTGRRGDKTPKNAALRPAGAGVRPKGDAPSARAALVFTNRTDAVYSLQHGRVYPEGTRAYAPNGKYYACEIEPFDQGWIAVFKKSGALVRQWKLLPDGNFNDLKGIAWGPKSDRVGVMYHAGMMPSVQVVRLGDDRVVATANLERVYHMMVFSDDGRGVLLTNGFDMPVVRVLVDEGGGRVRRGSRKKRRAKAP